MLARTLRFTLLACLMVAVPARAAETTPADVADADSVSSVSRESAHTMGAGKFALGLVSPFRWGITDKVELYASAIDWLLLAPNANVRVALVEDGDLSASLGFGLGSPSGTLWLLKGYLVPTWANKGGTQGVHLVPNLTAWVSHGKRHSRDVLTLKADIAAGIPLTRSNLAPLDAWTPVELAFAPVVSGLRARFSMLWDHAFLHWLRLTALGELIVVPSMRDPARLPIVGHAHVGVEFAPVPSLRIAIGGEYYFGDQRKSIVVTGPEGISGRQGVLSHDIYPSFDIVWFQN